MKFPDPTTVYGLFSLRDRTIRYIGQTMSDVLNRVSNHISDAKKGRKAPVSKWIRSEIERGEKIGVKVLFEHGDASCSEIEYINLYRALGAPLVNVSAGARLRELDRRHEVTDEMRAKISKAQTGRRHTEESKRKTGKGSRAYQAKRLTEYDGLDSAATRHISKRTRPKFAKHPI